MQKLTKQEVGISKENITDTSIKNNQTRTSWGDRELKQLKLLKDAGYTNYEIAEALNRPLNSILSRLYRESLTSNRTRSRGHIWTSEELDAVKVKVPLGITISEIAEELELSDSQVFQKAIHLGFGSHEIMTKAKKFRKDTGILQDEVASLKVLVSRQEKYIKNKDEKINILTNRTLKQENAIREKDKNIKSLTNKILKYSKRVDILVDKITSRDKQIDILVDKITSGKV